MPTPSDKDNSIIALLHRLKGRLGEHTFQVVDHWENDAFAIGIARPDRPGHLAYVSTLSNEPDAYFVSLELPPSGEWADHPYTPVGESNISSFEELAVVLEAHLSRAVA